MSASWVAILGLAAMYFGYRYYSRFIAERIYRLDPEYRTPSGTTNQILAGLTLLVISVILVKLGRPSRYTLIPMVFVTSMAFLSAVYQLWDLYQSANYLLVVIHVLIIIATLWVMLEAASALGRERRERVTAVAASAAG